ncbi:MAG: ribosome recycling factor [Candidatus Ancillula sp.]|jgi:ribosome recycling factor|nr:ribosome recycling factor [Candidatus Ancillula sp.]
MTTEILTSAREKMAGLIEHTKTEFASIRTGRANPALISNVLANYYGAPTPLQQLASFTVPENRVILVAPFDKSAIDAIVKGLQEANLGLNPSRDGDQIRVTLPEMTTERRQEYVKLAKTKAEDGKVALRSARHKAIDAVDAKQKDKEISEDDSKRAKEELDKLTKSKSAEVDEMLARKEKEILEV